MNPKFWLILSRIEVLLLSWIRLSELILAVRWTFRTKDVRRFRRQKRKLPSGTEMAENLKARKKKRGKKSQKY